MGAFGLIFFLFLGLAAIINFCRDVAKDERAREIERANGRLWYTSSNGKRLVSNNHRCLDLPDGLIDAVTGEVIVDNKKKSRIKKMRDGR